MKENKRKVQRKKRRVNKYVKVGEGEKVKM